MINNKVCLKRKIEDETARLDIEAPLDNITQDVMEYVHAKVLCFLKPVLFLMPIEKIEVMVSKEAKDKFGIFFSKYVLCLQETNQVVGQIRNQSIDTAEHENILFVETEKNSLYTDFFKRISKKTDKKVFMKYLDTGYNAEKRVWEQPELPFLIPDFITYLVENKIKTIYSINQYLLEIYLRETGVYLLSCFDLMGVEYICIDHDARDADLMKKVFTHNAFKRYSLAFVESRFWDDYYGSTNVSYPTIPHPKVNEDAQFIQLKDDYKIVVLSYSRLNQVLPHLNKLLYILEQFDENYLFSSFQTWHFAMIYFVREVLQASEFERLINYRGLNNCGYYISQFLKFEIIDGLNTDRDIEIYGDEYWELLFPDYYKGYLDKKEDIDELFSHNDCLYLLMNWTPTIFTSNPHLYDAINRKNPFTCYAPLVSTTEFAGFKHIEYDNLKELNYIVENINSLFNKPDLLQAIKNQQNVLKTSASFFEKDILREPENRDKVEFEHLCMKSTKQINQKVVPFVNQNELGIKHNYDFLFKMNADIDISKSKFFNRKYVQRMVRLISQG